MPYLKRIITFFMILFSTIHADNFKVVTVASLKTVGLIQLLQSAEVYNITVDVLGMGDKYLGNGQKLHYMLEYMKDLSDDTIILFIDGYDTFFCR